MIRLALLFSLCILAPITRAQSTLSTFDVASVKLNPNCQGGPGARVGVSPRNLSLPCMTLRALIRLAYGDMLVGAGLGSRRIEVLGGPGWLDSERFDILAKSESTVTGQSAEPMLKALLEERFQVKVHKEGKESSVYTLGVAGSGHKMQLMKEGSCTQIDLGNLQPPAPLQRGEAMPRICGTGGQQTRNGSSMVADWYGVTMSELAGRMLVGLVDLPVVDQTGLTERFDVHIEYVRDNANKPVMLNGVISTEVNAPAADPTGATIFAALEKQLGLKLSRGRVALDVIIVDHAEKPSAN